MSIGELAAWAVGVLVFGAVCVAAWTKVSAAVWFNTENKHFRRLSQHFRKEGHNGS